MHVWSHPSQDFPPYRYHFDSFLLAADSLGSPLPVYGDSPVATPKNLALIRNSPNPFCHETRICYSTIMPGRIVLRIYDLFGREVETLVSEYQLSGEHEIRWTPAGLPSGMYISRLQMDSAEATETLLLLR